MTPRDVVSLDSETERFGPCNMAPRLVCVSYAWSGGEGLLGWREAREFLVEVLRGDARIVGHGVAYDFLVWLRMWPELWDLVVEAYEADRIEDTEIRQKLLDIAGGVYRRYLRTDGQVVKIGYGLDDLAKRHLQLELDKVTWRTGYGELRDVPVAEWPQGAKDYAILDAVVPLDVHAIQEQNARFLKDQHRQARAALWLKAMSTWGVITDPAAVAAFERQALAESTRLSKLLEAAGLKRPDRVLKAGKNKGTIKPGERNMARTRELVTQAYGGNPPLTDTGLPCTDEATCSGSGNKLLEDYAKFSSITKVLSTDVPLLKRGVHEPIHAYWEVLKENGRTGSSPNMQNWPREGGMRECLIPRPGCVFAAADYTGMELRTWAQVCIKILKFSDMAAVLNSPDGDPHLEIAAGVLGISFEEAKRRKAAGDDEVDNARQVGKIGNFGFQGGMGPDSFVAHAWNNYGVRISREQAVHLKEVWRRRWREAQPYLNFISDLTDRPDAMVCHLGSERYRGGMSYTDTANTWFSGMAADTAKAAGWLIFKACYVEKDSVLYGSRPVLFVHDEFLLEVPLDRGHECALELARLMVEGASPWLPDVPPKAEPVLMRRYSKKAKPVRVNGRLVPWG